VTGSSPTAAWQELYKAAPPIEGMSAKASAAAVAARAASVCGPRLFGLQHPVIAALIESLPDAGLCESFLAWKGPPPAQQVTVSETRHDTARQLHGFLFPVWSCSLLTDSALGCTCTASIAQVPAALGLRHLPMPRPHRSLPALLLRVSCCMLCAARALRLCWRGA
jgi:hypothetical protein